MFDWLFTSSCPCDPAAKAWVEERLQWLDEEFDDHAFNGRPLVLPTSEFFPDRYDGSEESVRTMFDRVCGYMDVVPDLVSLRFKNDVGKLWFVNEAGQYLPQAAGTYESGPPETNNPVDESEVDNPMEYYDAGRRETIIRIDVAGLDNPMDLVGTMAHELAHVRLLGEGRIASSAYDNELLTDLTVVFFGLGIFLANVPRHWDSLYSTWPGTSVRKPEYMTPPMFGYALAHLAWFRNEERPSWASHLHLNARPSFKQAVRFLFQKAESDFKPVKLRSPNKTQRRRNSRWS